MDLSGAEWRKAERSTNNGGACVEVAGVRSGVAVRDSKDPDGPVLLIDRTAFRTFTTRLRRLG